MTSDPWIETLRQIDPNYDQYQTMIEEGPNIVARARKVNLRWRVRIEENWDHSNGEYYYTFNDSKLDSRCKWAEEQLKSWRFVGRLSHQEWYFFNRKQAEKFVTLFNLRWAE